LRVQINGAFPTRDKKSDGSIGDAKHASRKSDHNPWLKDSRGQGVVTAIDITHDPKTLDCNKLADVLFESRDPRIKYLIWNRKITTPDKAGWKKYTGANAHSHHLHVSVSSDPRLYDGKGEWDLDGLIEDVAKVSGESDESGATDKTFPEQNTANIQPAPEQVAEQTTVEKTDSTTTQITSEKNQQDVNKPADVVQPEPYNGVGFWATIKGDLAKVGVTNGITQTASEYAQQAQTVPEWMTPIVVKLAYIVLVAGIGYLLFRVIHYLVDTLKKNKKTELEVLAKTDINRKDVNWT
jgi:hypothetical protein